MPNLLFIPGIKGSELFEGNTKRWFPNNEEDLKSLEYSYELEAKKLIEHVNAYFLIRKKIYSGIVKSYNSSQMDLFPYDWRKPIHDHVDKLIERIELNYSVDNPITLVAHSMGGMLAKITVLKLEELGLLNRVKKLITLGTPWLGAPSSYKALVYGEPGLFEDFANVFQFLDDKKSRALARQYPSVYQLLPSEEYFYQLKDLVIFNGEKEFKYIDFLLHIQTMYNEQNKKEESDIVPDIYNDIMKPVHEAMKKPLPKGFVHDCLIGSSIPTLYGIPEDSEQKRRKFKSASSFKNGDGTVPIGSALPPHSANIYYVDAEHSFMCSDKEVIDFIKWASNDNPIQSALPEKIYLDANEKLKNGVMAHIMCPIDSTILDEEGRYIAGVFDTSVEEYSPLAKNDDVKYYSIGESHYLYIPEKEEEDLRVEINTYATGIAEVSLHLYDEGPDEEIRFDPIPVTRGLAATVHFPLKNRKEEATLIVDDQVYVAKKRSVPSKKEVKETPLPQLQMSFSPVEDTKKAKKRRLVFSGDVTMTIKSEGEPVEEIYYSINDEISARYTAPTNLSLPADEYIVHVFGKDHFGRVLDPLKAKITIDRDPPKTKLHLIAEPEGMRLYFDLVMENSTGIILYRIPERNEEWKEIEPNEEVSVPWRELRTDPTKKLTLEYYSINEFGVRETNHNILNLKLGDLVKLIWGKYTSSITSNTIWVNFIEGERQNEDFEVFFIGSGKSVRKVSAKEIIPDNIKGVRFNLEDISVEVMYAEKYSLYFNGPPKEVLEVGQEYEFSFELIAERSKERIVNTDPQAKLHPIRANDIPDKRIKLTEKNGTYYGQFTVTNSFLQYRYKLVITDIKNISPSLREISLIMREEDE